MLGESVATKAKPAVEAMALERHFHLARCILLCFQKVVYSSDDSFINDLVLRLRWGLARHIGARILEKSNQLLLSHDLGSSPASLFERDVSELLGFTYGHD